jgi:hypothetical protein
MSHDVRPNALAVLWDLIQYSFMRSNPISVRAHHTTNCPLLTSFLRHTVCKGGSRTTYWATNTSQYPISLDITLDITTKYSSPGYTPGHPWGATLPHPETHVQPQPKSCCTALRLATAAGEGAAGVGTWKCRLYSLFVPRQCTACRAEAAHWATRSPERTLF